MGIAEEKGRNDREANLESEKCKRKGKETNGMKEMEKVEGRRRKRREDMKEV